jgi:hypothetical protein
MEKPHGKGNQLIIKIPCIYRYFLKVHHMAPAKGIKSSAAALPPLPPVGGSISFQSPYDLF